MNKVFIVFPHQLFKDLKLLQNVDAVYLVEEFLFFKQYKFHKHKLVFHRATMMHYKNVLEDAGIQVHYMETTDQLSDILELIPSIDSKEIQCYDVADDWLEQRIKRACSDAQIELKWFDSPAFLNTKDELAEYFDGKESYFHNDFYIAQRKKRKILVDDQLKPIGGKWSFDAENRHKFSKKETPPAVQFPERNEIYKEAIEYVEKHFASNYGSISSAFTYPISPEQSHEWLNQFLAFRFHHFGKYEDAIVPQESILHHSLLSPLINAGLLTPQEVIDLVIQYANENDIELNNTEGLVRQIIGWREFIRGVYIYNGRAERTKNYWNFKRKIPASFYDGTTGIEPIDQTIKKVLKTGYCHHIERLMILGNFMLLCEFDPDEVYQWFMELFIDAYDWVMVTNVYGMSQFADGGLMATKPYISGSNYVLKMSNYSKGEWCTTWDALFWQFMHNHRSFFEQNPRLGLLLKTYDKMSAEKKENMRTKQEDFIKQLQ